MTSLYHWVSNRIIPYHCASIFTVSSHKFPQ